jgi:hypothetical protein
MMCAIASPAQYTGDQIDRVQLAQIERTVIVAPHEILLGPVIEVAYVVQRDEITLPRGIGEHRGGHLSRRSPISQPAKDAYAFDDTAVYAYKRASLNNVFKQFVNDVAADPLVYTGTGRERIQTSVGQALCRAVSADWEGLPDRQQVCTPASPEAVRRPQIQPLAQSFREREVKVFMLANQLPLLQSGLEPATVRDAVPAYCRPDGRTTRIACSRKPT